MTPYTKEYYEDGVNSGLSNYERYEFKADQTISWATHFKKYLGIKEGDTVLDVGAAKGHYCQALRMLGVQAYGYDVSEYAVANCYPAVKPFMSNHLNGSEYDYIYSKDALEHIPPSELHPLMVRLLTHCKKKMFVIVPLAFDTNGK